MIHTIELLVVFIAMIFEGAAITTGSYKTLPLRMQALAIHKRNVPIAFIVLMLLVIPTIGYPIVVIGWLFYDLIIFKILSIILLTLTTLYITFRKKVTPAWVRLDAVISFWCLSLAGYSIIKYYI